MKQEDGIKICKKLHNVLSERGYYPALTGGLLYKDGDRKDCYIVIYRNRQQHEHFEMQDIESLLEIVGFSDFRYFGFVTKAHIDGFDVDLFNPESYGDSEYGNTEECL